MPLLDHSPLSSAVARLLAVGAASVLVTAALAMPASAGDRLGHAATSKHAPVTLSTNLNGAREVPGPGDPNGTGRVTIRLKPALGKVCAHATWMRIGRPIAAHIHKGGPAASGGVVVDLTGAVTGGAHCTTASRRLINQIASHPKRYYFNIHTGAFQAGAIRGQLHR